MKKLLQHQWIKQPEVKGGKINHCICEKCGCEKYFVAHRGITVFETKKGITVVRPDCKLPTFTKFPGTNDIGVGGYDGGDFYKY